MKQIAAHYLYLPHVGFVKQGVVHLNSSGEVVDISVLTSEVEALEWHPGTIVLVQVPTSTLNREKLLTIASQQMTDCSKIVTLDKKRRNEFLSTTPYIAFLLYPFDFIAMLPVDETQHRQLL